MRPLCKCSLLFLILLHIHLRSDRAHNSKCSEGSVKKERGERKKNYQLNTGNWCYYILIKYTHLKIVECVHATRVLLILLFLSLSFFRGGSSNIEKDPCVRQMFEEKDTKKLFAAVLRVFSFIIVLYHHIPYSSTIDAHL